MLILLALLVLLPAGALLAARLLLDEAALKGRAIEAVRRATGRELTIAGPLRLTWSLTPSIEAQDVSLANPPGLSRPAMAHADSVQAHVALWPLLSGGVVLSRIVVRRPDVLLEGGNWQFPPQAASSAAAPAPSAGPRFRVAVQDVVAEDARLGWLAGGTTTDLSIPRLAVSPETGQVAGSLVLNGVTLAVAGTVGPGTSPAPLNLTLTGGGIAAALSGNTAQPALTVTAADLHGIASLLGRPLPSELAGATLARLEATGTTLDQPAQAKLHVTLGQQQVTAALTLGSLSALLRQQPMPLTLVLEAAGASVTAKGTLAGWTGQGIDLAVSARVADAQGFGLKLRDVVADMRVASAPGGPGLLLRGLRLTSDKGDLSGDLALTWLPRPALRGSLVSQRLDFDLARPAAAPPPPRDTGAPVTAPLRPDRVLPDIAFPFDLLRRADADLHLGVGQAVWRGVAAQSLDARLVLQDGKLRLDPVTLTGPGGPAQMQLLADATTSPPSLAVTLRAPGLAAGPLLALLGAPDGTAGTIDLDAQLAGQGGGLRAWAATLDGHLGAAMLDGEVENRWLVTLLADALRAANIPLDAEGRSHVRCLALRADAAAGQVTLRALALDTTKLRLDGEGGLALGDESLDLHLRPQLRVGGTGVAIPLRLRGTLRAPKPALDAGILAPGRVGLVIGGPPPADTCGPALALARDGRPGPMPAPMPEAPARIKPADLLRSLLR